MTPRAHDLRGSRRSSRGATWAAALLLSAAFAVLSAPQLAVAYPITSLSGVPATWVNSDAVILMWTDLGFSDPNVETFYALSPTCPPLSESVIGAPEGEMWDPGHGWIIYTGAIPISAEGTTTIWFWSYRFGC